MRISGVGSLGNRTRLPVLSLGSGQHEPGSSRNCVTHHSVLAIGTQHALMNAGNDYVGVQNELRLKRASQW